MGIQYKVENGATNDICIDAYDGENKVGWIESQICKDSDANNYLEINFRCERQI